MEHIALYRQFRPSNFDEIVEQKAAVAALRQTVVTGRLGHAYLFCGQRGTGKTSIARVFSRAINCQNPVNGNPCNSCPTCKGILDGSLMDVIEIDAASNNSVSNIRKICEEVNFAPSVAPHKVYIIDEVHMITNDAFNALLKTLEEPPAHAVFLFATTEPHRIPATILSRCQRYDFRRITPEAIVSRLRYICEKENINADTEALRLISSLSDGAMRDAISVLDQAASSADGKLITPKFIEDLTGTVDMKFLADLAGILIDGKFDELLLKTAELADSGRDIIHFSLDLAEYFRNLLIVRTVPNPTTLIQTSADNLKRMYEIAATTNAETLVAFITAISKMISELKWSPSVRTSMEIFLIRLCGRKVKTDIIPLTIPDFADKQAKSVPEVEAAVLFKQPATSEPEPAPEILNFIPVPETKPVQDEVTEAPAPISEPAPIPEETKAPEIIPSPFDPISSPFMTAPISAPVSTPIDQVAATAPVTSVTNGEDEEGEDNTPMENQMDLFSMATMPEEPSEPEISIPAAMTAEPSDEPVQSEAPEQLGLGNVLAGLSDNFLDDLISASPAEPSPIQQPTGRHGEAQRTALAQAVEETPIAQTRVVPEPEIVEPEPEPEATPVNYTPEQIWEQIINEVSEKDYTLSTILREASFKYNSDSVYIIFADNKTAILQGLKGDSNFRSISTEIKQRIAGITHVYLCTNSQYDSIQNPVKKTVEYGDSNKPKNTAESFVEKSKNLGINTEIHFGDN